MFLKDVTNVPTRSQSIMSKLVKIGQELTVENVHVVNHGVRDKCLIKWDTVGLTWMWKHLEARGVGGHAPPGNFEIWGPWMAENALEILQSLCFLYLKAWPSPDFQRFKTLTLPHYSKMSLMTLPQSPPSPPINNIPSLLFVWSGAKSRGGAHLKVGV